MPDQNASNTINELKVSGHTMTLEPGLYCVFSAPGSQAPAGDTGLPVVRITTAPGPNAGHVEVSGLSKDGWISPDSATLVRVTGTPADVLVTVYQARNATSAAPQIQVLRLAGADAAAPKPDAGAQPGEAVQVLAHIYGRGDVGAKMGDWVGEPGSKRWIEGFGLAAPGGVPASDVEYQAVLGRGWLSPWSEGGQFCGSRGMSLPILGLRVRLRGASANAKRISLEATFVDGSRAGPVGAGEPCEAESLAALEAFRLVIEDAAAAQPKGKAAPKKAPAKAPAEAEPTLAAAATAAKPPRGKAAAAPAEPPKAKAKPRAARTPPPTRRR